MRHKRIAGVIPGILLAVLVPDSFIGFLPFWLVVTAGTITIFLLLSGLRVGIITPIDKVLGHSKFQVFANALCGSVAYIWASIYSDASITGYGAEWLYPLTFVFFMATSIYSGMAHLRYLTEDQLIEIWAIYGGRKEANEELAAIKRLHNTRFGALWIFLFRYVPAVFTPVASMCVGILVGALAFTSVIFPVILLVWLIIGTFASITKRRNTEISVRKPDIQKNFIEAQLQSGMFASIKGVGIMLFSTVGIINTVGWIYVCFSISANGVLETIVNGTPSLSEKIIAITIILPVAFYQLYFWYRIFKRLPHFLTLWKTQDITNVISAPPLLKGGDYAIFISFFIPLSVFLFTSLNGYMAGISICTILMFSFLLIGSLRDKFKETSYKKLLKDNLRIPLACYSSVCGWLLFLILFPDSYNVVKEASGALLTGFLIFAVLFYDKDLERWIRKYRPQAPKHCILAHFSYVLYIVALLPIVLMPADWVNQPAFFILIAVIFIAMLLSIIMHRKSNNKVR